MSQHVISGLGSISKLMKILEDEHAKNILVAEKIFSNQVLRSSETHI